MTNHVMTAALIKAQSEFEPISENKMAEVPTKSGGKFSYKYADLGSVLDAVMPALHSNGFALLQPVGLSPLGEPLVMTTLMHVSGESIKSEYPVRVADPNDPQKLGGGITYARRYSLISMLGLATEDDDGRNAATQRQRAPRVAQEPTPAPETNGTPPVAVPAAISTGSLTDEAFIAAYIDARNRKARAEISALMDRPDTTSDRWCGLVHSAQSLKELENLIGSMTDRQIPSNPKFERAVSERRENLAGIEVIA